MKKNRFRKAALGVLILWMISGYPEAIAGKQAPGSGTYGGGDGHTVPTPFAMVNQKFELADGEYYYLQGRVTFLPADGAELGTPYLMVSLEKTPWLANAARVEHPYYRLQGNALRWRRWNSLLVKILCRAHVTYIMNHDGQIRSEIELEPWVM